MPDIENEISTPDENETPAETPVSTDEPETVVAPIEEAATDAKEESKASRFFRKVLRWTLGLLIVFGLGFTVAIFALYRPTLQKVEQGKSELAQANEQIDNLDGLIATLEGEIENLQALKDKNQELTTAQKGLNLHVAILNTRLDVANALLSLSEGDDAQAHLILNNTAETLNTIESLLESDQRDVVTPMRQRLELVLTEMENDSYAAQSDLDVLATSLLQLEDALFGGP